MREVIAKAFMDASLVQILVIVATTQTRLLTLPFLVTLYSFEGRGGEGFLVIGKQARVSRS